MNLMDATLVVFTQSADHAAVAQLARSANGIPRRARTPRPKLAG